MAFRTEESAIGFGSHCGAEVQAKHATHLIVEFFLGVFPLKDETLVGIGQIIAVVGVSLTHSESVGPRAELHVQAVCDGFVGIVGTSPVTDYNTVKFPVLLENTVKQNLVMTVVLVFIQVVGAHDAPCVALLYGSLEGRQINFVQGTVGHFHIDLMTVFLLGDDIRNTRDMLARLHGWSDNSSSKAGSSIKGITEEQSDLLISYVNAMRLDLSVNRVKIQQIADAVSAVPELNNIAKSQLSQLQTLVSLAQYRNGKLDDMYSWMKSVTKEGGTKHLSV